MDDQKLTREIGLLSESGLQRTDRCPDEYLLVEFATGSASREKREPLVAHIAACEYCLARIGELARLDSGNAAQPISDLLLARAAKLGTKQSSNAPGFGIRPRVWAAAAVLVLGVAVLLDRPWVRSNPNSPIPEVRRIDPEAVRPQITWPTPGMSIDRHDVAFRWTPVSGSLYYDVQVLSDSGDLLWRRRVDESRVALPDTLELTPGSEYFLRVDAYLAEARSVSSQHVVFSIRASDKEGPR